MKRRLVWGLALTQTVAWGVLYYAFPVLLVPMQGTLGWSRTVLVGGFTVALVVSGVLAPVVGRWLDTGNPRRVMAGGSVLATAVVVALAGVDSLAAYYLTWIGLGAAMAMVLYEPAFTVLAKRCAPRHRRAITIVTLVAGLASFIFQPLTSALLTRYGWRTTLLILAAVLAVVTVPIHSAVLRPAEADLRTPTRTGPPRRARNDRPPELADGRFWRITLALAGSSMASFATSVLLVAYLVDHGWPLGQAASASGVLGAMQLPGRVLFGPLSLRWPRPVLVGVLLAIPALGVLGLLASGATAAAWPAIVILGMGQGAVTLLRATLFVDLYGTDRIGILNGMSAGWIMSARAAAPLGASALVGWTGSYGWAFGALAVGATAAAGTAYRVLSVPPQISPTVRLSQAPG